MLYLRLPPLRERVDDIKLLAEHFIGKCSALYGEPVRPLDEQLLAWMKAYPWPGNVRELENFVHRAFVLSNGPKIGHPDAEAQDDCERTNRRTLQRAKAEVIAKFEREFLAKVMAESCGNVTLAARLAGKERRAFGRLLKKYGLRTREPTPPAAETPRSAPA